MSLLRNTIARSLFFVMLTGTSFPAVANPSIVRPSVIRAARINPLATVPLALGGGSSLPSLAYLGTSVDDGTGQTSYGVAGSVFGYLASQPGGINIEYCNTGSGKGKNIFDAVANVVDVACGNAANTSASVVGFFPPSGGTPQTYPTVTGTDAPLQQSEYTNYINNHPSPLEPVELPALFGSIAIIYNDPQLGNTASRIVLTDAQLCSIFDGGIQTFGQLLGTNDPTLIRLIYRSDGSGTSFSFSNHLAAVCPYGFYANQLFTVSDPKLPSSAIAANGISAEIQAFNSTPGAIAYIGAAYAASLRNVTGRVNYAYIKNTMDGQVYDPFSGLPAAANSISSSSLLNNVQVVQKSGSGLAASAPATTSVLTGIRSGNCVKVINPRWYASVTRGYSILAVTYLLTNSAGNGSVGAMSLRLLEDDLATPALFKGSSSAKISTVDEATNSLTGTTGFSSLGASLDGSIKTAASSCIDA